MDFDANIIDWLRRGHIALEIICRWWSELREASVAAFYIVRNAYIANAFVALNIFGDLLFRGTRRTCAVGLSQSLGTRSSRSFGGTSGALVLKGRGIFGVDAQN